MLSLHVLFKVQEKFIYRIEILFIIVNVRNMASLVQYTKFKILLITFTSTYYSQVE